MYYSILLGSFSSDIERGYVYYRQYVFNVHCVGSELKLADCSYNTTTYRHCRRNVVISCNSTCAHGDLRLVGGRTSSEGRMEVCINGFWRRVCDSSFDTLDARVVCRQLGYTNTTGNRSWYDYSHIKSLHTLKVYIKSLISD